MASPVGLVDGVDYGYAGRVRKINIDRINTLLSAGDVVLIGCLGEMMLPSHYHGATMSVCRMASIK